MSNTDKKAFADENLIEKRENAGIAHDAHAGGDSAASGEDGAAAHASKRERKPRKRMSKRAKLILIISLSVIGAILVGAVIYGLAWINDLRNNPHGAFDETPTPTLNTPTPEPSPGETPEPTPTIDPYLALYNQADLSMMNNVVNILVIGVDYSVERETWDGKQDYHADVMMVIAVNFDEGRVDLISLPRDTYAQIPGVEGIYKLNASINCGGGYNNDGFMKVCEAASWMLGGIPVDYYYAVNMPTVKALADAIGGVDYDVEMAFTMAGRSYEAGYQHLDGQGVLDYMRVRKNIAAAGDLNRIDRQKRMMIALFNAMKERNLILMIPDIVEAFDGQLHTNASIDKTMALALFAYDLDTDNIGMHSMGGTMQNIFGWNFCLTDQERRVSIIEEIYNIKLEKYLEYTPQYANYRWESMLAEHYMEITTELEETVTALIDGDAEMPTPTLSPTPNPSQSPTPVPRPTLRPSPTP
ncbi:MAG: LCP family protein, partial [Clostridia bacterium]|nr:LCP family protein [Clostridia bacterium]